LRQRPEVKGDVVSEALTQPGSTQPGSTQSGTTQPAPQVRTETQPAQDSSDASFRKSA